MPTVLLILCGLVWLPILIYQIDRRGFLVLLVWLFIAPIASNIVNEPGRNPFFPAQHSSVDPHLEQSKAPKRGERLPAPTRLKLTDWFEPNRILFGLLFVVLLLQAAFRNRLTRLDRVEKLMLAFSVILVFGALRSVRILYSMRTAIDCFIIPFLGYYTFRRLVTSEERLCKLTQVVCGVGCYLIVIALIERLSRPGLYFRLGATFGHHNPLSFVMAMVFLLMLADTLRSVALPDEKLTFPRSVRWFALYLAPVIVLLTWNRGNWVGFLMSAGIFLFLSRRLTSPSRKLALIGLMLIFLSVVPFNLQAPALQTIAAERVTQRTGTVYARIGAWMLIIQESSKAPMFGIGLNKLFSTLGTTQIKFMGTKSESSSHNSYLSLFVELGLIGLLTYLAIVIAVIRMGLRLYRRGPHARDRWRGVTVVGITVAYLVPALFGNTLYLKELSHVYVYVFMGGIAGLYGQRLAGLHRLAQAVDRGTDLRLAPEASAVKGLKNN